MVDVEEIRNQVLENRSKVEKEFHFTEKEVEGIEAFLEKRIDNLFLVMTCRTDYYEKGSFTIRDCPPQNPRLRDEVLVFPREYFADRLYFSGYPSNEEYHCLRFKPEVRKAFRKIFNKVKIRYEEQKCFVAGIFTGDREVDTEMFNLKVTL